MRPHIYTHSPRARRPATDACVRAQGWVAVVAGVLACALADAAAAAVREAGCGAGDGGDGAAADVRSRVADGVRAAFATRLLSQRLAMCVFARLLLTAAMLAGFAFDPGLFGPELVWANIWLLALCGGVARAAARLSGALAALQVRALANAYWYARTRLCVRAFPRARADPARRTGVWV